MQIVDNAPEMALDDPKFIEAMAQIASKKVEKADTSVETKPDDNSTPTPSAKTDVKPAVKQEEAASSAEELDTDEGAENDESPEKLKARVRGLQAELSRRKGNADKVNELELQLAKIQGQLEQANKPSKGDTTLEDAIRKLDDKGLITKQTDWEDDLADARARYASAEERGDDTAMSKHGQRIAYAKHVLSSIRTETLERSVNRQKQAEVEKNEADAVRTEFDEMYKAVNTEYPDFQDKESDLWKAGDKEYRSHPEMMRRLGPVGEVVAAALAIIKNPQLVQRSEASARRDVVGKLEKSVKKALSTGGGAPSTGRTVVPSIDSADGLAEFNRLIDKIKGG